MRERVDAAKERAAAALARAATTHRRAAEMHGRAAEFYSYHARLDARAGLDELAAALAVLAERERERAADQLRLADEASR